MILGDSRRLLGSSQDKEDFFLPYMSWEQSAGLGGQADDHLSLFTLKTGVE